MLNNLDKPANWYEERYDAKLPLGDWVPEQGVRTLFRAVQDYSLRISWKKEVRDELGRIFGGRMYE